MSDLFDLPFEEEDGDGRESIVDGRGSTVRPPATEPRLRTSDPQRPADPRHTTAPAPVAARRVWSVTELTVRVRDLLEAEFFEVWVEGELSNCRVWNTGHLYFTLKDGSSSIRSVIFRSALRSLKFKPADGLRVVARGRVSVYEPKGEYQLVCEHLEPHGLGALQLAFDQLKKRLQDEGLFDAARKRPLPALPRKIGIVTSLDGAAIRDIIKILRRRYRNAHLVICPARVQGEDAAPDIARALRQIARVPGVEVVIVGRGGGSIADFVADVRAPTPSAAAELVVSAKDDFCDRIDRLRDRVRAAARGRVQTLSRRVHVVGARPAFAAFPGRLAMRGRHAAELAHALARIMRAGLAARERSRQQLERQLTTFDLGRRLAGIRTRLVGADGRLIGAVRRRQHRAAAQFGNVAGRLDSLSPLAVLARGYAVAWNADKTRVLRDASTVTTGDRVRVTLARGELDCEVRSAEGHDPPDQRAKPRI